VIGIGKRKATGFDEPRLKKIASPGRYWFIGDKEALVRKFEKLAGHLRVAEE